MKVIFSVEPIRHPLTGIGRYAFELASRLAGHQEIEAVKWFKGNHFVDSVPVASIPNAGDTLRKGSGLLARYGIVRKLHGVAARLAQERALSGTREYLYHGPNFYLPAVRGPAVVTFHDLSILKYPQFHPVHRVCFMSKEIELSLKRATLILADSEYGRQEIAEHYGWPLERIATVPLAGGKEFRPRTETEIASVLQKYDLRHGGYVLYAGTIEPRKNLERLLQAYEKLPSSLKRWYPLILVGYRGWNNEAILARIEKAQSEGWARYLGYVPGEELPLLYSGARLFTFPSIYEGFGLPVIEAMASGVPVICSNNSCLPEAAGDAAALCDAEDVDGLSMLMDKGLSDDEWRQQAVAAGLIQARKFSWERCLNETVSAYQKAERLYRSS